MNPETELIQAITSMPYVKDCDKQELLALRWVLDKMIKLVDAEVKKR